MKRLSLAVIGWFVWTRFGDRLLRRHTRLDDHLERYVTRVGG